MFGPSLCRNGRCLNTVPGYTCLCNPGYHYNAVHRKCEGEDASPPSPPHPRPLTQPLPASPILAGSSHCSGWAGGEGSCGAVRACMRAPVGKAPLGRGLPSWAGSGEEGEAGCYLFVISYKQTFHEDGPGASCLGTAPHVPSVFLPPQITTSARTWPVRMVNV